MPSRSFFEVPDQNANVAILREYHSDVEMRFIRSLANTGIAPLYDAASIARVIGVSQKTIYSIQNSKNTHYRKFEIRKNSKQPREICAPRTYLKVVQWWILDNILKFVALEDCVTGFRAGSSPFKNASLHSESKHLLLMDLKDFFPSISAERVLEVRRSLGYRDEVAQQLADLTTFENHLPQGAPTSPHLANLVARELDKSLVRISENKGYKYSRYADDMTFSSMENISVQFVEESSVLINEFGFQVNAEKTRFRSSGSAMEVTGYLVNSVVQPPRWWRKNARAAFHQALQNPDQFVPRLNYIRGLYGAVCAFASEENQLRQKGRRAIDAVSAVAKSQ